MLPLQIDLPTVLMLHISSFIAGALGILSLRFRGHMYAGLKILATSFMLLGIGGLTAGLGEWQVLPYELWTHLTLLMGTGGYALMWSGITELSGGPWRRYRALAFSIPVLLFVLDVITKFSFSNDLRATAFHLNACFFLTWTAFCTWQDHKAEPLQSRGLVSGVMLCSGLLYGARGVLIFANIPGGISMAEAFFLQIVFNFCIVLLVMAMVNERAELRLRLATETDELTGVGNRRYFMTRLASQAQHGGALATLDLDHFKNINDSYGHDVGDLVLAASATTMRQQLRGNDILARFGGEEFVIFFPSVSKVEAQAIGERIRRAIEMQHTASGSLTKCPVTVSIGLVWIDSSDQSWSHWLKLADTACYEAKRRQRNCVFVH